MSIAFIVSSRRKLDGAADKLPTLVTEFCVAGRSADENTPVVLRWPIRGSTDEDAEMRCPLPLFVRKMRAIGR